MRINIIGCGSSAKHWTGEGQSIGVNDCAKVGIDPTYLLLLNSHNQFPESRLEIIKRTRAHRVYADLPNSWNKVLTAPVEHFQSRAWAHSNRLQKVSSNYLYHSKTSPFAAISLAFSWGFKEIILWGVDMVDHPTYKPGTGPFINEYASYKTFCASLNDKGCKVYLGHEGSNLNFLPIWQK